MSEGTLRVRIEVISEGPHCTPCLYAIEAVEQVANSFGPLVAWEVVSLREHAGVGRFRALRRVIGSRIPIPAVIINEQLAFDGVPDVDDLRRVVLLALETGSKAQGAEDGSQ
jgi:hypothetical protein